MNTPSVQIGRVVSSAPLIVQIGDLQVDRDNLLIDKATKDAGLSYGNQVAVLPTIDRQTYIILARLVNP